MPKQTKSSTAKVKEICRQYLFEFGVTPALVAVPRKKVGWPSLKASKIIC